MTADFENGEGETELIFGEGATYAENASGTAVLVADVTRNVEADPATFTVKNSYGYDKDIKVITGDNLASDTAFTLTFDSFTNLEKVTVEVTNTFAGDVATGADDTNAPTYVIAGTTFVPMSTKEFNAEGETLEALTFGFDSEGAVELQKGAVQLVSGEDNASVTLFNGATVTAEGTVIYVVADGTTAEIRGIDSADGNNETFTIAVADDADDAIKAFAGTYTKTAADLFVSDGSDSQVVVSGYETDATNSELTIKFATALTLNDYLTVDENNALNLAGQCRSQRKTCNVDLCRFCIQA